jgi:NADH-quinone oxidoreductase subunit N
VNDALVVDSLLESFRLVLPEIVLAAGACVCFLGGLFRGGARLWGAVSLLTLVGAGLALALPAPVVYGSREEAQAALYAAPVVLDSLAVFIKLAAICGGAVLVLFSWDQVPDRQAADYHACLLLILAGMSLTGAANDLILLFVALELMSIPTYVILYLPRHDGAAQEAALKYFLLSIFSSALLLFGFSYLYGMTGVTNLSVLLHTLNGAGSGAALPALAHVALIMVLAGLGFRITMVPFHFYAPDVYQGTATVLAAMLAYVPKAAGFAALVRVLGFVVPELHVAGTELTERAFTPRGNLVGMGLSEQVPILLWFLAAVTMSLGNLLALRQDNLKRLLAYSSVAHAGYMLIALAVAPYLRKAALEPHGFGGPDGVTALLYYLIAYGAMTIGAFAVIAYLDTPQRPVEAVDDLAGLGTSHPGVAVLMVIFLFSLIGIPLTAGFTGKLLIFFGAMGVPSAVPPESVQAASEGHAWLFRALAVLGVLNAAVGAWYYLRIIAVMYLRTSVRPPEKRWARSGLVTMLVCAVLTIGLSFPPGSTWLLELVRGASGARSPLPTPHVAQR